MLIDSLRRLVQPIIDEVHAEEVHLFREVPVTHIKGEHYFICRQELNLTKLASS